MKRFWTNLEVEQLRHNYGRLPMPKLCKLLGRSRSGIKSMAQKEGLCGSRLWTEEEDQIMRDHYEKTPWPELMAMLPGRSKSAIWGRGAVLGIERENLGGFQNNPEAVAKGKVHRFRKGHTTFNKGRKMEEWMNPESIERSKATRFKRGNLPHNTKYDGHISIRKDSSGIPYIHVRTRLGKYELLHRLVWEKHNGPIPEGHCIAFKDGNSLNPAPENLECITRAENMTRNTIHRYRELDPELYKTIYALIGLKESITAKKKKKKSHEQEKNN